MKKLLALIFGTVVAFSAMCQVPALNEIVKTNTLSPSRVGAALEAAEVYTASGTDTYTVSISVTGLYSGAATYASGDQFTIVFTNANATTTPTLNINSEGAITIVDNKGDAVAAGDIEGALKLMYDGTNFRVIGGTGSGGGGGTVTAVNGTTNRVTSTGGATPTIDISASYVGQSSITTIGTLSSGTVPGTLVSNTPAGSIAATTAQAAINELDAEKAGRPIDGGALSGTELTFDAFWRKYSLDVTSDIGLTLAASGNVADSYITIYATGNGTNELTFPQSWFMSGEPFDHNKINQINLEYTGTRVSGVIKTLGDVVPPVLSSATITNGDITKLNLFFDEPVEITTAGWSVSASGGAVTLSSVAGSSSANPIFTMSRGIVSGETVTISYNTGTGNTTDTEGNELATVSGFAVTNGVTIVLSDFFDDGTIDAAKWDVTDPADGVTISETGGRLRFAENPASPVASTNDNHVDSDQTFNTALRIFRATLYNDTDADNQAAVFKAWNSSDTYATARQIQIAKTAEATPKARLRIFDGATFIYDFTTTQAWNNTGYRIVIEADNDIIFQYWNGTAWTQLGTTQNYNIGGAVKIGFSANSTAADSGSPECEFDTFYATNADFTTVVP